MGTSHHYGPAPWIATLARPEWNPTYYNRADANGIGFDRTATGSNAVAQYAPTVAARFAGLDTVPDKDLLWFHHVPWDYKMRSGRTLWDELIAHYSGGVAAVAKMRETWAGLKGEIDPQRFDQTAAFLAIQQDEAQWWRDASIAYFQSLSQRPLQAGEAPPKHPLAYYEALKFPYVH
jgi:alpha-glucuronidase